MICPDLNILSRHGDVWNKYSLLLRISLTCNARFYLREFLFKVRNSKGEWHLTNCVRSVYLNFSMRPIQAWKAISRISTDLVFILKTDCMTGNNEKLINAIGRCYWAAWVIEKSTCPSLLIIFPTNQSPVNLKYAWNYKQAACFCSMKHYLYLQAHMRRRAYITS